MRVAIEFDLPDETIVTAARKSAIALFTAPEYSGKPGPGWAMVAAAAQAEIAQIDWGPIVRAEIARLTPDVVRDVTGKALRAMVREQIKAMKEAGTLLDGGEHGN